MSKKEKVLDFIRNRKPEKVTNSDISRLTGIQPNQQVFKITERLRSNGKINGEKI